MMTCFKQITMRLPLIMLMVIVLLTSGSIAAYGAFVDEIVFVDDALEDYKMLMDSIPEGVRVVVLDGKKDGIEQMAEYLKNKNDLDAIHIISHGGAGEISVGTAVLNSQTMGSYLEKLDIIGQSLKENGDLLLYGCDVASGGLGKQFVENVARITDADVAASEDETGSAAQGGNWILEFQSGIIDTRTGLFSNMDTYPFLLEVKEDLIHTYSQNTWAFNKLAVDPDGTIYLTHKVSGTEIAVKEWNGTSWSPLPSITTANTGDTGFSDDLDLAVDSNNKLHIAFRHNIGSGVTSLRGVKYGLYNGSSWTFAEIEAYSDPSGGKNFDDPSIAVDSEGFAHMVYLYSDSTGYYLKYATNRSGSWVTSTVVVGASGGIDEIHNPGIVIDGNNIVHVSYVKEDNQNDCFGNYYYTKKTIGETNFPTAQKLIDAVSQGKNYYYTPLVSDSSNSLYFAYYEESYDESYAFQNTTSYLNTNKSGSWQSTQVNYDNVRMTSPIGVYVVNSKKYLLMHSFSADWSENYFFAMADYGSGWFKGTKTIIPALVEVGGYEDEREFVVDSSGNFMLVMLHGELKKISSLTGTSDDFGLGTLAPEDVEITGFDAISNVSAGTAGSATYSSVAEVQAALHENVTANAGAVTVPVTAWVDTDGYNPAVAGSYTFTATLGAIPSGYANPNDYTATVEVVVSAPEDVEITGFDAISNVSAGTAGSATYSSVAEVQAALHENVTANAGAVTVPVTAWVDTDGYNPAVAGSYTFTATLGAIPSGYANPNDYTATVEVVVSAPEDVEITGFDAISNVSAGTAGSATYSSVAEVQAALHENVTANAGAVTVPVTAWVDTDGYNPAVAGSYTFTATLGAIPSGYANPNDYTATVEVVVSAPEDVEITGFDAISNVSAGTAGSATYSSVAEVQAALHENVTANAGAVTVPVTAWVDTDGYNPAVAGSYTFTAILGSIPSGYANPNDYTATVEVVVSAPEDVEITGFDAISNVSAGTAGSATYSSVAEVQAALHENVTANAGAVTVPVTAWVDTDGYNPAVAGSYTFTAILGAIPSGYANPNDYTATVEVVVSAPEDVEITGFDAISNVSAGTAGSATYSSVAEVQAALHENVTANAGAVTVPVTAWVDTDGYNPAVAGSYTFTAILGAIPSGYANPNDYTATVEVVITGTVASNDATLKTSSTIKGQTVTSLGTPSATLGSVTGGTVTITAAKAADTSNTGSFITLFEKNNTNATVKVVKYASGASTAGFASDTAYANQAISNGDFFIIKVTAEDTLIVNYYKVKVTVTSASSGSSGGSGSSATTTQPSQVTSQNTVVVVNGKEQNAGKETQKTEDGKSTVTVAIDNKAIENKIDEAIKTNTTGLGNVIQVPVADTKSEVAKVELTGDIVKKLEENTFEVSVKRDNVEYIIPAAEFTISKVAANLGIQEKALADIKVEVKITKLDEKVVEKYNEVAKTNGAELVFPPVQFEITAKTTNIDGTTKEHSINKFSNYVERVMEIPSGVDPSKITTGIVFNVDGTYSHVPTEVYQKGGKWYAKLNSLTNSDYSVIWNPITVRSVENHWSKDAVNDMASRLVIFNSETFEPDKAITRADFAEYIVRGLGLYREGSTHKNNFKDVTATGERTLAILIANEYGVVSGYADGTFRGDNQITREEAMAMYQRAMKITKLVGSDENRYQNYTDYSQVSEWAATYVKEVLSSHVFNGTTETKISPKASLTYAEAAQAIRNLLVESNLINK